MARSRPNAPTWESHIYLNLLTTQQELKRRTRKIRVFPNTESLERLVSAVLVEIDDKWASAEKAYIKWECQDD